MNIFDQYGRVTGYGQMAPGRDLPNNAPPGQPGRPRTQPYQDAILGNTAGIPSGTFAGASTVGNTGVSGRATGGVPGYRPSAPATQPAAIPPQNAAPDYSSYANTLGQFTIGNGQGYDPSKLADPTHGDSAKYRIGRVLSHFDLSKGLQQPGVQEALNAAHLSDGGVRVIDGDEIELLGKADPSMGRTRHLDLISDFDSGHGRAAFLQQDKGGIPQGAMPNPFQSAILGTAGTPQAETNSTRLRQLIMQALAVSPELAPLAKGYL